MAWYDEAIFTTFIHLDFVVLKNKIRTKVSHTV